MRCNLGAPVRELVKIDATGPLEEPNLHQADFEFTMANGGTLTRELVRICRERYPIADDEPLRIDSRLHYLEPGQSPGVCTWHTDFRERDRELISLSTMHMLLISEGPRTEFYDQRNISMSDAKEGRFPVRKLEPWTLYVYDSTELHRSRPHEGTAPIWRYFFRLTIKPLARARLRATIENKIQETSELSVDSTTY